MQKKVLFSFLTCYSICWQPGYADWGVINKDGRVVIKPQFEDVTDFSNGCAGACLGTDAKGDCNWVDIDIHGNRIRINDSVDKSTKENSEDLNTHNLSKAAGEERSLVTATRKNSRWFLRGKDGSMIGLPKGLKFVGDFHEGLAAVAISGNLKNSPAVTQDPKAKWGFINTAGKIVIAPRFANVLSAAPPEFSEGLAAAAVGDFPKYIYGFIDKEGKWSIPPSFGDAHNFSEGMAAVNVDHANFSSNEFKRKGNDTSTINRYLQFEFFLSEHRLVGMPKRELINLLGPPSAGNGTEIFYTLNASPFHPGSSVILELKNQKVARYGFSSGGKVEKWITK